MSNDPDAVAVINNAILREISAALRNALCHGAMPPHLPLFYLAKLEAVTMEAGKWIRMNQIWPF